MFVIECVIYLQLYYIDAQTLLNFDRIIYYYHNRNRLTSRSPSARPRCSSTAISPPKPPGPCRRTSFKSVDCIQNNPRACLPYVTLHTIYYTYTLYGSALKIIQSFFLNNNFILQSEFTKNKYFVLRIKRKVGRYLFIYLYYT